MKFLSSCNTLLAAALSSEAYENGIVFGLKLNSTEHMVAHPSQQFTFGHM